MIATNKSELFNRYAQWVAFGSSGLATAAERDEQRRMVKYNLLVANLLIFLTVVGMTRALDSLAADGHGAAITPEALAGTSSYLNEHLHRFGSDELDPVDAAFGPVFRYFDRFEATLPPLSVFDATPKVRGWRAALAARPSVRDAVAPDYPERLAAFLRARRSHLSCLMT